jgi:hypothetical protein
MSGRVPTLAKLFEFPLSSLERSIAERAVLHGASLVTPPPKELNLALLGTLKTTISLQK